MPFNKTDVSVLQSNISALNTAHENLTGAITDYEEARSAAYPEILLPEEPEIPELEPFDLPANPADPLSDLPMEAK